VPIRKPRKPRPKETHKGYDSKFEYDLHTGVLKGWEAHPKEPIPYTIDKRYFPDFFKEIAGRRIYIESKGRFWDSEEYAKYKWCRKTLANDQEIVFIFMNPDTPMPKARVRQDGTKLSHGEWATKLGFRWYSMETFPKELM
jgi:hypothetical protein